MSSLKKRVAAVDDDVARLPAARRARRPCRSVIAPAGSMTQTARGCSQLADEVREARGCRSRLRRRAPPPRRCSGRRRRSCGRRCISRRTMLPPIRPRPIIPSCMSVVSLSHDGLSAELPRRESVLRALLEPPGSTRRRRPQMHAQRAAAALGQHLEIAARLRRLDDAEACTSAPAPAGRAGVVAGDLQEHAGVRPALVGLAGRVQEARPEAEAGRDPLAVADQPAQPLQRLDMRRRCGRCRRAARSSRRRRAGRDAPSAAAARLVAAGFSAAALRRIGEELRCRRPRRTASRAGSAPVFS